MRKKYLIIPGEVTSKYDGDLHHVSAKELMRLYGVSPKECVVYDPGKRQCVSNLKILGPLYEGNYEEYSKKLGIRK